MTLFVRRKECCICRYLIKYIFCSSWCLNVFIWRRLASFIIWSKIEASKHLYPWMRLSSSWQSRLLYHIFHFAVFACQRLEGRSKLEFSAWQTEQRWGRSYLCCSRGKCNLPVSFKKNPLYWHVIYGFVLQNRHGFDHEILFCADLICQDS